jgi:aspartate carbamoyltransferase catalytic subunit
MKRSIVTIEDLTNQEILNLFKQADKYLDANEDEATHRLRRSFDDAHNRIAATLFFEPSTRTRLSFETAMFRLGGQVISCADPKTSSSDKGESLADTIRVVQTYADLIILRHPSEGAARVADEYADVPVINAGDGGHEHPTQTLCDLYTLYREKKELANLNVLVSGDLKNGRTVHSLVYALARFGAHIILAPAKGFELPMHVAQRLEHEYNSVPLGRDSVKDLPDHVDVVYITPQEPHSTALITVKVDLSNIDVYYVTRLQTERLKNSRSGAAFPVIDKSFLQGDRYSDTRVMHPLPRVRELGYDLDKDPRGAYFQQTAYGVPIRMALIAALLRVQPLLERATQTPKYDVYLSTPEGIRCTNKNCILKNEAERRHLTPKMWIVDPAQANLFQPVILRCIYCEYDYKPTAIFDKRSGTRTSSVDTWRTIPTESRVFCDSEPTHKRRKAKKGTATIATPDTLKA